MRSRVLRGLVAGILLAFATPAAAVIQYGDARIAGYLYSQALLQHDGLEDFELAQTRNVLNATFEYRFVKRESAFGGAFRVPGVDTATLYLEYRGSFDPIFLWRDGYVDRFSNDEARDFRAENKLREIYLDLGTKLGPGRLSMRVGKQQAVWGEADVVRSLDVINPLDFRRSFLLGADQPNLDEYRIPLWMLKLVYSVGKVGPIANASIETIWIPGDIEPLRGVIGEVLGLHFDQDRRPSNQPFRRVRHPWEITRIGPGFTEIPAQAVLQAEGGTSPLGAFCAAAPGEECRADLIWFDRDTPFGTESSPILPPTSDVPSRAWIDHAEAGIRFTGQIAPFGKTVDFSLNYFYTYSDIPAAFADFPAIAAALFGDPGPGTRNPETGAGLTFDQQRNIGSDATIWIPAALVYPRTHIFGGTLTYSDVDWTGLIWRMEVSHQTDDPRIKPRPPFLAEREGEFTLEDFEATFLTSGPTTRAMLGADLFRSFPFLDGLLGAGQPFFISGQIFVEYKEEISNTIGTLLDVNDRQKRWNPLYTLLAQYFHKGGTIVPVLIALYDQDSTHFAVAPLVELHPRNWLTLKVGQIWFTGSKNQQSSRFLHTFADRDQTFVRLQYGF